MTRHLVALSASLLMTSAQAAAQPTTSLVGGGPRVVLVAPDGEAQPWVEMEHRITAELRLMGFEVLAAEPEESAPGDGFADLAHHAREHQATAALTITRGEAQVDLWIWVDDGREGRTVHERIELNPIPESERESYEAIALVEVVRACLLELDLPSAALVREPVPEPAPEPEPRDRDVVPSLHLFRVTGGFGGVVPFDPPYGMAALQAGGGYRLLEWLVIDADFRVAVSPYVVRKWNGSSQSYLAMLCAYLTFEPWPRARVSPGLGVGGGLLIAWTHGEARVGFEGNRDTTAVGSISASFHLGIGLTPSLRLLVRADIDIAVPDIDVRFAGDPVAVIGRPLLDIVIGIEWGMSHVRERSGS